MLLECFSIALFLLVVCAGRAMDVVKAVIRDMHSQSPADEMAFSQFASFSYRLVKAGKTQL